MQKDQPEELFLRFCREDDVAALGRVFDQTAPELMKVATHLAGGEPEAEDALQATFQTVIEKRLTWDSEKPVLPWMLGILNLHVRRAKERAERAIEEDRLPVRAVADPSSLVAEQELGAIVESRIEALPESYSSAVRSYLVDGVPAREIARALGITANAASVRLHRGLKLLQRGLPAGVSLGAAGVVLGRSSNEGLGAIRATVLREATRHASQPGMPVAASAAASATATTSALLTGKHALLATGVLAAAVGAFYLSPLELGWEQRVRQEPSVPVVRANAPVAERAELALPAVQPVRPGPETREREELAPQVPEPALDPEAWLVRINGASDWRAALVIGNELNELSAEDSLRVMEAIFHRIEDPQYRRQILKPFAFSPRHEQLLAILHLAVTDPSLEVQKTAFVYLREIAFQDFSEDITDYKAWYSTYAGLPIKDVLVANAGNFVARLFDLENDELMREVERFRHLRLAGYREDEAAIGDAMRDAGLFTLIEGWIAGTDPTLASRALSWAGEFDLEESWLRNHVVALLDPSLSSGLHNAAARALGKRGNDWAIPLLFDSFLARAPEARPVGYSEMMALAEIGNPEAIPRMIGILVADPETHYSVGYFGLSKFTGVDYDESHGAEFWLSWWENNQERLPAEIRGMSIPAVSLPR